MWVFLLLSAAETGFFFTWNYHTYDEFDIVYPSTTQDACYTWTLYVAQLATSPS